MLPVLVALEVRFRGSHGDARQILYYGFLESTVCTLWTCETFSLPACDAIATAILLIRSIQLVTLAVFFRRRFLLTRVLIPCLDFADDTHSSFQCVCRPSSCRNAFIALCFGLVRPVHGRQPKRI